jgi:hypothetical protein
MDEKINIVDESGDKKFFTIIPNYVLNHSTHWDREVYIQMKKVAGETGTCFYAKKNLAKKCGIGVNRLEKSLDYLIEHKWITLLGKKDVETAGGMQPVKEYKINDIWKLNTEFYSESKGGVQKDPTPEKGGASVEAKGGASQVPNKINVEEDIITSSKEDVGTQGVPKPILVKIKREYGDPQINECFDYFTKKMGGLLDGGRKDNRVFCKLLLNKLKESYPNEDNIKQIKFIIDISKKDSFHARNATSFKYLYYNSQKIIQTVKESMSNPKFIKL